MLVQVQTVEQVATKTLALAVVSYHAPKSLHNSMKSWQRNGLLDVAEEKFIFLNAPTRQDLAVANHFGFRVFTTPLHGGNVMAGPALAFLVGNSTSDYILFLEKDFELSSTKDTMLDEMWTAYQHLVRGVDLYRLRGRSDWPTEGMPDCCAKRDPPACPYDSKWRRSGGFGDHMSWLRVFCDPDVVANSHGRVAQCTSCRATAVFTLFKLKE